MKNRFLRAKEGKLLFPKFEWRVTYRNSIAFIKDGKLP